MILLLQIVFAFAIGFHIFCIYSIYSTITESHEELPTIVLMAQWGTLVAEIFSMVINIAAFVVLM